MLPVIDSHGTLLGVVAAVDVEQAIAQGDDRPSAAKLVHATPELRVDESLEDAVLALAASDDEGLPVLAADSDQVVGWLTHRSLLHAYTERMDHP